MNEEGLVRVIASEGGLYRVCDEAGETLYCKPRGRFRHERIRVLVGDLAHLTRDAQGNVCIDGIEPRTGALLRPPVANADKLFVTVSAAYPQPVTLNIDKLTCIAVFNRVTPVIVITKSELDPLAAAGLRSVYESAGFDVFVTSAPENTGIGELGDYLSGPCADAISVFAGASGVGKSTLLNALFPGISQKTQEISRKIARGRHTTRNVVMFPLAELVGGGRGFVADTPGFSLLDFESFDFFSKEDLPHTFPEFSPYLGSCRYTKCSHTKEDGCAIIAALGDKITPSRHESYKTLYDQLKNKRFYDRQ